MILNSFNDYTIQELKRQASLEGFWVSVIAGLLAVLICAVVLMGCMYWYHREADFLYAGIFGILGTVPNLWTVLKKTTQVERLNAEIHRRYDSWDEYIAKRKD